MKFRFVFALIILSLAGLQSMSAQSSGNVVYTFPLDGITQSHYSHGAAPEAELVQGADGNFYGTTTYGGSGLCTNGSVVIGCGTIFMLTPDGMQKVLFNFTYDSKTNSSTNGIWPTAGLVQGKDGNFYGTASAGGDNQAVCNTTDGCGTIFRITPGPKFKFKLLHQFCSNQCTGGVIEGGQPRGRLIQASDGAFYGVTNQGGNFSNGTVYRISGTKFSTVYYFNGSDFGATDGTEPVGGLIEGPDLQLYGTTSLGGLDPAGGTIFKIDEKSGAETILHNFVRNGNGDFPDGSQPLGALILATDGNFYGTTSFSSNGGLPVAGTLFQITPSPVFTTLYDFALSSPYTGITPDAGVIQASDGNLYGTTRLGGNADSGTIYQSTLVGGISLQLSFDNCGTLGLSPLAAMLQAADGTLYTTTSVCGPGSGQQGTEGGTVVQLVSGLPAPAPSIAEFAPLKGRVGKKVTLTGHNFIGTTAVAFNGTSATFTIMSPSVLTAIVPTGASTGPISATNAGGTATSAENFKVVP